MTPRADGSLPVVGVLGATGKVGTELCLFLHLMEGVEVVAIGRNDLSLTLLRRCGVECRSGRADDPAEARRLLAGCSVVCDLSLPRGLASEVRAATARITRAATLAAEPGAPYVMASTYMSLGVSRPGERLRRRLLAGTQYGANKRKAEAGAMRAARRTGRDGYVILLGQVHGEFQAVSRELRHAIADPRPVRVPPGPSNAIFVYSVAEALRGIGNGALRPGRYAGSSVPQWSWLQLYEYWARREGVRRRVRVEDPPADSEGRTAALRRACTGRIMSWITASRDLATGYLLPHVPSAERKAKALHAIRSARVQIAEGLCRTESAPFHYAFAGETPGLRLDCVSDSRATMEPLAARVRELAGGLTSPKV